MFGGVCGWGLGDSAAVLTASFEHLGGAAPFECGFGVVCSWGLGDACFELMFGGSCCRGATVNVAGFERFGGACSCRWF